MPFKLWNVGEEVIAPDFNPTIAQQVVSQWANAAARTAGITAPVAGMVSWLNDVKQLEVYTGAAWVSIGVASRSSWSMLADVNLVADGPISFPAIPATYTHLQIVATLRAATAGTTDSVLLRCNADTGANYFDGQMMGASSGGTPSAGGGTRTGGAICGPCSANAGVRLSAHTIDIPNYLQTTFDKIGTARAAVAEAGVSYMPVNTWAWLNHGAISQLDLVVQNGSTTWKAGSRASLMAIK